MAGAGDVAGAAPPAPTSPAAGSSQPLWANYVAKHAATAQVSRQDGASSTHIMTRACAPTSTRDVATEACVEYCDGPHQACGASLMGFEAETSLRRTIVCGATRAIRATRARGASTEPVECRKCSRHHRSHLADAVVHEHDHAGHRWKRRDEHDKLHQLRVDVLNVPSRVQRASAGCPS